MTDQIGRQVGHRDDPRGVLAFESLPDDLQRAEDTTAVADRDRWPHRATPGAYGLLRRTARYMDRPATTTERILLQHLGFDVPDDLVTRVTNTGVRHRAWPALPDTQPTPPPVKENNQ